MRRDEESTRHGEPVGGNDNEPVKDSSADLPSGSAAGGAGGGRLPNGDDSRSGSDGGRDVMEKAQREDLTWSKSAGTGYRSPGQAAHGIEGPGPYWYRTPGPGGATGEYPTQEMGGGLGGDYPGPGPGYGRASAGQGGGYGGGTRSEWGPAGTRNDDTPGFSEQANMPYAGAPDSTIRANVPAGAPMGVPGDTAQYGFSGSTHDTPDLPGQAAAGGGATWGQPGYSPDAPHGYPGQGYAGGIAGVPPGTGTGGKGLKERFNPSFLRWVAVIVVSALVGALVSALTISVNGNSTSNGGSATVSVGKVSPGPAILANGAQIPQIVKKLLPAVVSIKASGVSSSSSLGGGSPFGSGSPFGGGGSPFGQSSVVVDEGTGMIITSSGQVVTNNHVIAGATKITVTLYGQSQALPAKLVGTDPTDDVALLQIENPPSNLPTVTFGKSSSLQVGDSAIAIGNALGLSLSSPTVTSGIISALGRDVQAGSPTSSATENLTGMIQTDAAINSGNSGGPLVDSAGQVIGMDTAVASSSSGNAPAQNIGFAIPSDKILSLLPELRKGGTVSQPKAFLGVYITSLNSQLRSEYNFVPQSGAVVMQVEPGSPAQIAGIQAGDVIVAIDRQNITSASALAAAIRSKKPGQSITITLWHGQQKTTVTATLSSTPVA